MFIFFFKQKTAYEMSISDWSSDVCSSDLITHPHVQHQRAKDVAVVIDQPLAVAQQMPLALETRVESLHHFRHTGGNPGVVDLEVGGVHAKPLQAAAHRFVTADEQRRSITAFAAGYGGAKHDFFLRLGEDHPLGVDRKSTR